MSSATNLPPKKDVARALLLRGSVFVHLDPRGDAVSVPLWLRQQPQLVLQVGLDMAVPIPDLKIDDEGICGTLSFNRAPFFCQVKWGSVFALAGDDGRGMVWPESMPEEIRAEVDREAGRRPPPPALRDDDAGAEVVDLAARRSARPPRLREVPRSPATPVGMDGKPLSFAKEPSSDLDDVALEELRRELEGTEFASAEFMSPEPPSAEPANAESPNAESPSAESPSPESPSAESPSAESPSVESPSAESPSPEPPSAEPANAASPSAEPPSVEPVNSDDDPDGTDDRPSSRESKRPLPPYLRVVK